MGESSKTSPAPTEKLRGRGIEDHTYAYIVFSDLPVKDKLEIIEKLTTPPLKSL